MPPPTQGRWAAEGGGWLRQKPNVCLHRDKPGGRPGAIPTFASTDARSVGGQGGGWHRRNPNVCLHRDKPGGRLRGDPNVCLHRREVGERLGRWVAPPKAQRLPPPGQARWAAWSVGGAATTPNVCLHRDKPGGRLRAVGGTATTPTFASTDTRSVGGRSKNQASLLAISTRKCIIQYILNDPFACPVHNGPCASMAGKTSDHRHQTSDIRPQTSDFRHQTTMRDYTKIIAW